MPALSIEAVQDYLERLFGAPVRVLTATGVVDQVMASYLTDGITRAERYLTLSCNTYEGRVDPPRHIQELARACQ